MIIDDIGAVDEKELSPEEMEFVKAVKAAEKKMQAAGFRRMLQDAGIDTKGLKNIGKTFNLYLGWIGLDERDQWRKRYKEEEEKQALKKLDELGVEYSVAWTDQGGGRKRRVIRIQYRSEERRVGKECL